MPASTICLVIGLPLSLPEIDVGSLPSEATRAIDFAELKTFLPRAARLQTVVAPLYCPGFDALDLIDLLGAKGFRGTARIVAPRLPNRGIVLRELRAHATRTGIAVELVERAGGP